MGRTACTGSQFLYKGALYLTFMLQKHVVICGLSRSTIFIPHYLINGSTFKKTLLNIKCVFSPSLRLLSEELLILRRNQLDTTINVHRSSLEERVVLIRY